MGIVMRAYDPELDRMVALKLLDPGGHDDEAGARLQREAQAMAQLAHPNAVTVFEVGRAGDCMFIAMELVDGITLGAWLDESRGWREIIAMFAAAGRGLEAAHRAGLVHRDFKPENVLIGRDGRPRVSDFGLAARDTFREPHASPRGTPAYMSPEQWLGGEVDAQSDQFSFCTAAWCALWGELPFAGPTVRELRSAVTAGERRAAPQGSRAPRWLERALARGLARAPHDRWPDLGVLLDVLDAGLAGKRRATWLAAGASGVAAIAIALAVTATPRDAVPCAAPLDRVAAVWGPTRRAAVAHHLLAIDPALGDKRFAAIAAVFDRGTAAWAGAHVSACRATRLDGGQSDTLLDLRMRCLDAWLGRVDDLASALGRVADRRQLDAATDGLASIGVIERCADTALLQAVAPSPVAPEAVLEVAAISGELGAIGAALRTGMIGDVLGRADATLARARRVGHPPILAEALALRAQLAEAMADLPTAIALLREIPEVAARAHDDEIAARSWSALIRLVADHLGRPAEASAMMPAARAASARLGDPALLLSQVLAEEGRALAAAGDTKPALVDLERARALLEAMGSSRPGSPAGPALIEVLHALAMGYKYATELDQAAASLQQMIGLADQVYGPDTVQSEVGHLLLAEVLRDQNKLEDADRTVREAIRICEMRTGPSGALAMALSALADITSRRGRGADAAAVGERALAVARATMSPDDTLLATIIAPVADSYDEAGRVGDALALYDEALAITRRAKVDTINVAAWAFNRASLLRRAGRCAEAVVELQRAAAIAERRQGPDSPVAGSATHAEGECLHELHRDAEAIAVLERSLHYKVLAYQVEYAGQARELLGRLLISTGRDRARGAALVREARARGSNHAGSGGPAH